MPNAKSIIICSKYFGYDVGGAEASTFALLREKESQGYKIKVYRFANIKTFAAQCLISSIPSTWEIKDLHLKFDWTRFYFLAYCLNKRSLLSLFNQENNEEYELYSYGLLAPAILGSFTGQKTYFIRDEMGLGWNRNYTFGWKRIIKSLYLLADYPFYLIWRRDLNRAGNISTIIANSTFIAGEAKKIWRKEISVIHPKITLVNLEEKRIFLKSQDVDQKAILMIGDNQIKGTSMFKKIARLMPNEIFIIVDRKYISESRERNIIYVPWQKDIMNIYCRAKLILVPSIINEAYGRVARESFELDLPVLVSKLGGLPEAVDFDENKLILDYKNPHVWVMRIKEVLRHVGGS